MKERVALGRPTRVVAHTTGSYRYAATSASVASKDGRTNTRYVHWGSLTEDNQFKPNRRYLEATPQERSYLVFPPEWDLSSVKELLDRDAAAFEESSSPSTAENKLYGAAWVLQKTAEMSGVTDDLMQVLHEDKEATDGILTLAMHPSLTGRPFGSLPRRMRSIHYPSSGQMDDARIRGLSRKVTLERIAEFTGLRMKRQRDGRLYVILAPSKDDCPDGPSGAAWHSGVRSAQDAMAIAYSFPSLRPVFYRPLPGCDPRALNDLCGKLSGLIDGGHVSLYEDADDASLSPLLDSGLPFVARVSPYKEPAIGCLMGMEWDDAGMPVDMTWDEGGGFYVGRFPVEGWGHAGTCGRKGVGDPQETSCVLVLDVERRAQELAMVTRALVAERRLLDSLRTGAPSPLPGPAMAGLRYHVVRVGEDEAGRSVIQEIKVDDRKVKIDRAVCGFTTFVTRRSADDARDALRIHGAYKRQVRYASCSTDCLAWPRNGEADDLLLFASFVGLTIDNALQGAIDRANGHMDGIETPGDVLDEMYDIRWTGGSDGAGRMGPLLDSQKRVAAALGLEG